MLPDGMETTVNLSAPRIASTKYVTSKPADVTTVQSDGRVVTVIRPVQKETMEKIAPLYVKAIVKMAATM